MHFGPILTGGVDTISFLASRRNIFLPTVLQIHLLPVTVIKIKIFCAQFALIIYVCLVIEVKDLKNHSNENNLVGRSNIGSMGEFAA